MQGRTTWARSGHTDDLIQKGSKTVDGCVAQGYSFRVLRFEVDVIMTFERVQEYGIHSCDGIVFRACVGGFSLRVSEQQEACELWNSGSKRALRSRPGGVEVLR